MLAKFYDACHIASVGHKELIALMIIITIVIYRMLIVMFHSYISQAQSETTERVGNNGVTEITT